MKKSLSQKIIGAIRQRTPLGIRHVVGPIISYSLYTINTKFRKNRQRPKVLTSLETADYLVTNSCSMIRFGDGEISLIDGDNLAFQPFNKDLSDKLVSIIKSNDPNLLICIPGIWEKLDNQKKYAYWFNMHHLYRYGHIWKSLLTYDRVYGDTNITRPYLAFIDSSHSGTVFNKLFSLWDKADVVLIEGEKSRLGVGNDMFKHVTSLGRILCPPENAYSKYAEIKEEVLKISKDKLLLISLGPTAKVLAYDLFKSGYRVLDIGHIDMEYEMFLRKEDKQTKVKYKYFNEIHERNPEDCNDETYINQIIATIK
jgi:glycosyltransferase family protein